MWLTAITALLVPAFLALGYWQLARALGGNTLSWAYVFEWPIFAGYLVYVRWRLVHEAPSAAPVPATAATGAPASAAGPSGTGDPAEHENEDEELAAYNEYLAALEESGRPKRW